MKNPFMYLKPEKSAFLGGASLYYSTSPPPPPPQGTVLNTAILYGMNYQMFRAHEEEL